MTYRSSCTSPLLDSPIKLFITQCAAGLTSYSPGFVGKAVSFCSPCICIHIGEENLLENFVISNVIPGQL